MTIKDIARALGTSTSTVSRALCDSHEIKQETKEKILNYINSINFTPNPMALSLRGKQNKTLAIIIPTLHNNFFSEVIDGIESVAFKNGYHVIIFQTKESYEREIVELNQAMHRRVDGILISLAGYNKPQSHFLEILKNQFPVVFFDRVPHLKDVPKITCNNFDLSYQATKQLIEKGAKKIGHITTTTSLSNIKDRLEGFKKCLADHNMAFDGKLVRICSFDPAEATREVTDLYINHGIDAIFTGSDRITIDTCRALKNLFPDSGKGILLSGFTNSKEADLIDPPISVIKQPAFKMGIVAAETLIHNIEAKYSDQLIKKEIII